MHYTAHALYNVEVYNRTQALTCLILNTQILSGYTVLSTLYFLYPYI